MKKEGISCIIPMYNEGKRILKVLNVIKNHPLIDEIIVVNDGSTDNSLDFIKKIKGIRIINYLKNRGKSYAVMQGLKLSKNHLIMLLDSDLSGLNKRYITQLIEAVKKRGAKVSISLRGGTPFFWKVIGLDYISGERVLPKELFGSYKEIKSLQQFGLEAFINKKIIENKYPIEIVYWKNVRSPLKFEKIGIFRGLIKEINMRKDIIKTIGFFGFISQVYHLLLLKRQHIKNLRKRSQIKEEDVNA